MSGAYRPVGPWILAVLAGICLALAGLAFWGSVHTPMPWSVALVCVGLAGCGLSMAATLEFLWQLRLRRADRMAERYVATALAENYRDDEDERTAA